MDRERLNNKGMTLIEIIVCFVIVVVIVLSILKIINNYKDKQDIESYKSSIITYKNTVTKAIWDDIIKHNGIVKYEDLNESGNDNTKYSYRFTFLDGSTSKLTILHDVLGNSQNNRISEDSNFYIQYGKEGDEERFEFSNMYNVQFNKPQVSEVSYSGSGGKIKGEIFHIYVGAYNPDSQIGDKYSILDIYTPNVSDYYYALGN